MSCEGELVFTQYPAIYALEVKTRSGSCQAYKTKDPANNFSHYTTEQRKIFI